MDAPGHDPERLTAGEGDWLRRVRAFDWSSTPLGPLAAWPHSLRTALQVHETEIDHLRRLQALSTRLVRADEDEAALLQDVVAAAVAVTNADRGELRLMRDDGMTLGLIASHGFEGNFDAFLGTVGTASVANEAARTARRVLVEDVSQATPIDGDTRAALLRSDIRAVQASPLLARDGHVLGAITTYHGAGLPGERDLLLLDLLSRQAADWIERSRAADRLEHSERQLRSVMHQTVAGVMVTDIDGRMTYVNPCLCRMLGYREDQLLGKHVTDITDPQCIEESLEALRQLEDGTPSLTIEKQYLRADGNPLWASASTSALRGPDGVYEGAVAVIIDIGKHKALESTLREQADHLQLVLNTGKLGTWYVDLRTMAPTASDQCKANFGLAPDEPLDLQRAFDELIHPDDRNRMRRAIVHTVASHDEYDAEHRVVWPNGEVHWIVSRGRAIYDADGHAIGLTGVNFDDTGRRAAMERLRENELQLRRTVEDAPLALIIHADDGEVLQLSRSWTEQTGYSLEDAPVLQDWLRRAYGIREGSFRDAMDRLFGVDHAMLQTDIDIVTRDGQPRAWSLNASSPGALKDGRRYVVAMAMDLTERKRAEALMRRSAARAAFRVSLSDALRPLADPNEIQRAAADTLCEYLRADRVVYAEVLDDHETVRVLSEHCGNDMPSLVGEHRLSSFGEDLGARLRSGRTVVLDDVHASSTLGAAFRESYDRQHVRAHVSVPLVKAGRLEAVLSVHQATPRLWAGDEIALIEETAERTWAAIERARAEVAVRESEARLEAELGDATLLQSISAELVHEETEETLYDKIVAAAMAIMHSQFAVLQRLHPERGNGELELLAARGFTPQNQAAWTWIDAGPTSQSCGAQSLRSGARTIVTDVEQTPAMDGSADADRYRRTGISAAQSTPLYARDGQIVGMLSTHWTRPHVPAERDLRLLDILARQAADLIERRQTLEDLRAADRRKDEFLATLAHELRNPLAPLRNCLHILRAREGDDAQLHKLHGMMERQVSHMVRLVDDLMEVSRITRGEIELRKQRVMMRDVLDAAIETSRPLLEQANHHFHLDVTTEPLPLDADPVRLAQVFTNLLNNAAKYTPSGGNITLHAGRAGPWAEIRVEDDGIGLAQDMLTQVFDMFTQSEHGRAHSQGGLGIGLTLVRSLVEQHGGTVEARSAGIGRGSEFVVRLPLVGVRQVGADSMDWPIVRDPQAMSIVVADDNHESADSMALFLQMQGHDVRTVYDGRACVEAVAERKPDVVLLDLGMPLLDGYETCQQIRAMPGGDRIAVLATTGWGTDADRLRSQQSGFDAHLVKPVDPEMLLARLDALH
ncbi:PAS domain S-box protein [Lysobacter sp. KIS68-7]|uniref:PAS domain S-box protein n=1 Tax=Lysobacter sp. KIS68-7 TaxID=2904252 RepID=UPI001E3956D4|nr:PAS domain S-box protein [Lysobacter sp. KIS68-7]UHQ18698.1 PAS domain S-box protein [Lysobacter sp. KIS68-7]